MKTCKWKTCGREFEPDNQHPCVKQRQNYNNRKSVEKKRKRDMCTCCGVRPKDRDFRFLCRYCFEHGGDYEEHGVYIGRESAMFG